MIVALTGASGFIGRRLVTRLQDEGHRVRVLGRRAPSGAPVEFFPWDAITAEAPAAALSGCDAVIHLAGEPVAQRWTADVKRRILDSRILGTRNLVAAMSRLPAPPRHFISASAIGYYGDRGDEILNETSAPGTGFLPEIGIRWEAEALRAALGCRTAIMRIGIVLGTEGGALKAMLTPFRSGVGGPVGSGKQWVSWIHVADVVEMLMFSLGNPAVEGPINATAPNPVRNSDFAHELGRALHRPSLVHTPAFALKMLFGEMAQLVLASQRVVAETAVRAGFAWQYPELAGALHDLLTSRSPAYTDRTAR